LHSVPKETVGFFKEGVFKASHLWLLHLTLREKEASHLLAALREGSAATFGRSAIKTPSVRHEVSLTFGEERPKGGPTSQRSKGVLHFVQAPTRSDQRVCTKCPTLAPSLVHRRFKEGAGHPPFGSLRLHFVPKETLSGVFKAPRERFPSLKNPTLNLRWTAPPYGSKKCKERTYLRFAPLPFQGGGFLL
jgi:hypothetical protein